MKNLAANIEPLLQAKNEHITTKKLLWRGAKSGEGGVLRVSPHLHVSIGELSRASCRRLLLSVRVLSTRSPCRRWIWALKAGGMLRESWENEKVFVSRADQALMWSSRNNAYPGIQFPFANSHLLKDQRKRMRGDQERETWTGRRFRWFDEYLY